MSPFEYVTVLSSIILGLGITQIITGIADLVHQWSRVKVYWPHLLWIILVFFLHIQEWWATYELVKLDSIHLPTFLFVLLYPINLFILARLLFPLVQNDGEIDLRSFYLNNFRKVFLWASILPVLSLLTNVFVTDHPLSTQFVQFIVFCLFVSLVLRKKVSENFHKAFAVALLTMMIAFLAVMWNDSLHA